MAMAITDRLIIPVQESNEVVVVPINQLPEVPDDVLDVLTCEAAPLSIWFDFARAYLANNKVDHYLYILNEGTSKEVAQEAEKFFGQKPIYEQIQFFCGLASYNVVKAKEEKDKQKRNDLFAKANNILLQAKSLNPQEQLPYLGTGLLAMARGQMEEAKSEFDTAMHKMNNGRSNIIGHLAMASLLFGQKQYGQSLALYKRAIRDHPGCPAEVRLGLAACHFKMGELSKAEAAYERVLALDPDCADAYLGLAVIKFNSSNVQQGLVAGLQLLVNAYNLDPSHVGVTTLLSHLCLLKGQYDKVLVLARAALDAADSDAIRADCLTQLARAHHAKGQFNEASAFYAQATRLDSSLALPHLGLAQLYLRSSVVVNACTELERAVDVAPHFYDALKLLGQLLHSEADPAKKHHILQTVLPKVREAVTRKSQDAELWEMQGELTATNSPQEALQAYKKALELHRKKQALVREVRDKIVAERRAAHEVTHAFKKKRARDDGEDVVDALFGDSDSDEEEQPQAFVAPSNDELAELVPDHHTPAKLLNNAAVLFYRSGECGEALALMEEANRNMERGEGDGGVSGPLHKVTLSYNMARLREAMGDYKAATAGYKTILQSQPGYIDCYLRLACIARNTSDMRAALDWVNQALSREAGHADALALMAQLHMERREWDKAKELLVRLLEQAKDDKYALLMQGNRYLGTTPAPAERKKDDSKNKLAADTLKKSLDHYKKVLQMDRHNIYAANGIGAVLAEQGHLDAAKEIFVSVQEAAAASGGFLKLADVWVNLANIHLAKSEYVSAVRMYQNLLAKFFHNKNAQVLLYLARTYYDSDDLVSAKRCLAKAIHLVPTDHKLRFNVALTMQEWAVRVYRKTRPEGDTRKLDDYILAQRELEQALKAFDRLNSLTLDVTGIAPVKLKSHLDFCTNQLDKFKEYIEKAQEESRVMAVRRQAQEAAMKNEDEQRRIEELKRKGAEEHARKEREKMAADALEREQELREKWRMQEVTHIGDDKDGDKGSRPKKKRQKKEKVKDDFIEDDYQDNQYNEEGDYDEANDAMMKEAGLQSDEEDHTRAPKSRPPKKDKGRKRLRRGGSEQPDAGGDEGLLDDEAEPGHHDLAATGLYDSEDEALQDDDEQELVDTVPRRGYDDGDEDDD